MVRTASTMIPIGRPAPDFSLLEPATGKTVSLSDLSGAPGLLVIFMCNHCPYVKHIAPTLAAFTREYRAKGLAIVGINANDPTSHPDDGPQAMPEEVRTRGYEFPYLFDETQEVAKAYEAACTPDFFLYDKDQKLAYRGQFDASRPSLEIPVTGSDLGAAADAVLAGRKPTSEQTPSLGCNIKWRLENAPA